VTSELQFYNVMFITCYLNEETVAKKFTLSYVAAGRSALINPCMPYRMLLYDIELPSTVRLVHCIVLYTYTNF